MEVDVWGLTGEYLGKGIKEDVFGDDVPEGLSEMSKLFGHPKITLKDGSVVYGCECWWRASRENPEQKLDFKPFKEMVESMIKQKERM